MDRRLAKMIVSADADGLAGLTEAEHLNLEEKDGHGNTALGRAVQALALATYPASVSVQYTAFARALAVLVQNGALSCTKVSTRTGMGGCSSVPLWDYIFNDAMPYANPRELNIVVESLLSARDAAVSFTKFYLGHYAEMSAIKKCSYLQMLLKRQNDITEDFESVADAVGAVLDKLPHDEAAAYLNSRADQKIFCGDTVIHEIARLLNRHNIISKVSDDGWNPIPHGYAHTLTALVSRGARPEVVNDAGETPDSLIASKTCREQFINLVL